MNDDGLRCVAISITTRARAIASGRPCATEFVLRIDREDEGFVEVGVADLERVGELVRELNPAVVRVHCADSEDRDHLLKAVTGESAPCTPERTLH